jgi:hypothetical protein
VELRGSTPFRCVPSSVRSVESAAVALRADVTAILAGSTMPALPPGGDPNAFPSPRKRPTSSGPLPGRFAWDRICKLYGWPQTFVLATRVSRAGQREYVS